MPKTDTELAPVLAPAKKKGGVEWFQGIGLALSYFDSGQMQKIANPINSL
jgi:hypothetical protein